MEEKEQLHLSFLSLSSTPIQLKCINQLHKGERMAKGKDVKKEVKKKPEKSLKEKREEKKAKKA